MTQQEYIAKTEREAEGGSRGKKKKTKTVLYQKNQKLVVISTRLN